MVNEVSNAETPLLWIAVVVERLVNMQHNIHRYGRASCRNAQRDTTLLLRKMPNYLSEL